MGEENSDAISGQGMVRGLSKRHVSLRWSCAQLLYAIAPVIGYCIIPLESRNAESLPAPTIRQYAYEKNPSPAMSSVDNFQFGTWKREGVPPGKRKLKKAWIRPNLYSTVHVTEVGPSKAL